MNRDELLTKLAMELGDWPSRRHGDDVYHIFHGMVEDITGINIPVDEGVSSVEAGEHEFTGYDWLQRRAELINKPSWDDAPEWAEWLAQCEDGMWRWFRGDRPDCIGRHWWPVAERWCHASSGNIPSGHDWRDTLEKRPARIKTCRHCNTSFQRPSVAGIPNDRCERCHDEIMAKRWDEGRADAIGQNGGDGLHYAEDSDSESPLSQALGEIAHDCSRCGGEWWSPPHSHCPCEDAPRQSKYHREIKPGVFVDVYDVLAAWDVSNPALQHLIKKALQPGERGHKTIGQDMDDIVASAKRARELVV